MVRHRRGVLERAAILQVGSDAGRGTYGCRSSWRYPWRAPGAAPSRTRWPAATVQCSAARCRVRLCERVALSGHSRCRCLRDTRAGTPRVCGGRAWRAPCRPFHADAPTGAAAVRGRLLGAWRAPRRPARTKTPSAQSARGPSARSAWSHRCVEQLPRFRCIEHRRLALFLGVTGAAHRRGRVMPHDLAGDEPISYWK